ncbi:MAG: hypothetical protein HYV60_03675 [Planctomycetia bacterium]|nr:hypothetical protein [Planctomycetia bacterium]
MTPRRFLSIVKNFSKQQKQRRREQQRRFSRKLFTEQLEERRLLAGPEFLAIRPDQGALLQEGDTLNVPPREFSILFEGGANIKESTILNGSGTVDDSVRLVRSGGDGVFGNGNDVTVALGFVGLNEPGDTSAENMQRIVLRPASYAAHNASDSAVAFADDTYQIQIKGTGATPLTDRTATPQAFNSGNDLARTFRLDRGAQVVAIVPQPVSRNTQNVAVTGGPTGGSFLLFFDGYITNSIARTATAATLQSELDALANIQALRRRPGAGAGGGRQRLDGGRFPGGHGRAVRGAHAS